MRKVSLVVALVVLGGLAATSFADVQNIRLSGDIRTRGYWLNNAGDDGAGDQNSGTTAFIDQRTRVSVEADLEDHVLVVVTLKAQGLWGTENSTSDTSGAGTGFSGSSTDAINKGWDTGVDEAYVQLNEMFYTPATVKIGRQYLMYGRGLILSSVDQEYNFDAARLVLDYYPLTLDFVFAELVNNQSFGSTSSSAGAVDLLFVNGRYEIADSPLKNVEGYFGWVAQGSSGPTSALSVPPTDPFFGPAVPTGASPWIVGGRIDLGLTETLTTSIEAAYEGGAGGAATANGISAYIVQVSGRWAAKDKSMSPSINWGSTWASGGGEGQDPTDPDSIGAGQFIPWFDYQDGYNGYIFCPLLSNIHIVNLGGSIRPYENTTFSVQGYWYRKMDSNSPAGSNPNLDFGGISGWDAGPGQNLGVEIDGILGYDYSKDVRLQLVYGAFIPGNAYKNVDTYGAATVQEVRGEINVKF